MEDLRICHVNCQSLYAHFDEFKHFFCNSNYHAICLSETWLKPAIPDRMISMPGFTLYRHDRVGKGGGGVAFYIRSSIGVVFLRTSDEVYCNKPEFIIAEIAVKNAAKLLLATVYGPPNCGFLNEFENIFLDLQTSYRHSVIFGDFNSDMSVVSYDSSQLLMFIESSSQYLVPYQTTHHLKNSSSFLDLCIVDDSEKISTFGQHCVPSLSAHDLIYIHYKINVERGCCRRVLCRDFRNFNEAEFLTDLRAGDWERLMNSESIEEKVDMMNNYILQCLDEHAPIQLRTFRNFPAPWLTSVTKLCPEPGSHCQG